MECNHCKQDKLIDGYGYCSDCRKGAINILNNHYDNALENINIPIIIPYIVRRVEEVLMMWFDCELNNKNIMDIAKKIAKEFNEIQSYKIKGD